MREQRPPIGYHKLIRYALQGVSLGLIVSGIVVLLTIDRTTLEQLRRLRWEYLCGPFLLIACAWLCSGARSWLLTNSLGYRLKYNQALAIALSTEFGIAATPAGMGGMVMRVSLLRKAGIPVPTAASLMGADASLDVFVFLALAPFALLSMLADAEWNRMLTHQHTPWISVIVAASMVLLLVLAVKTRRRWLNAFFEMLPRLPMAIHFRLPGRLRILRQRLRRGLEQARGNIQFLAGRRRGILTTAFLLAMVQSLCRYGVLPFILYFCFDRHFNPMPLIFMQGCLFVVQLLLILPGGGGGLEAITPFVLRHFVPLPAVGLVLVLWRFFTYYLYLFTGGLVFFHTFRRLDAIFSATTAENDRIAAARGASIAS